MTGTERSALRLALGMLRSRREWRWHEIANVLEAGGAEGYVPGMRRWSTESPSLLVDRQLTCRVALYIRAVLRADALGWDWIDLGGFVFADEEMSGADLGECRCNEGLGPSWRLGRTWENARAAVPYRIARPLWLDARGVER